MAEKVSSISMFHAICEFVQSADHVAQSTYNSLVMQIFQLWLNISDLQIPY